MRGVNRFGLARHIPASVARQVREKCGFGCVVCGNALVDYEHFDPEFKDAQAHDAKGIILLCQNCHRRKGAFLGRETIANAAISPFCRRSGFAWTPLDINNATVEIGPFVAFGCTIILEIRGEPICWFNPPETSSGPTRLNLLLYNENGSKSVWVEDNIWRADAEATDVQIVSGNNGYIRVDDAYGPIFEMDINPPHNVTVGTYRGWHRGDSVMIGRDTEGVSLLKFGGKNLLAPGSSMTAGHCRTAASIG